MDRCDMYFHNTNFMICIVIQEQSFANEPLNTLHSYAPFVPTAVMCISSSY